MGCDLRTRAYLGSDETLYLNASHAFSQWGLLAILCVWMGWAGVW